MVEDEFKRKLVKPWLINAEKSCAKNNYFEGLIYLWIVFNSWLSSVCIDIHKVEVDRYLIEAAGWDNHLRRKFEKLKEDDRKFCTDIKNFAQLWPVFKTRVLRNVGVTPWSGIKSSRGAFRERCFSLENDGLIGKRDYAPRCYREHIRKEQKVPDDFAHVLRAIYAVRCDLFHGGKSIYYGGDTIFVELAFKILWTTWGEEQYRKLL